MAKRKKAVPAGQQSEVAVLEPPKAMVKPPIEQVERSDKQCSRCSGKIEMKGEFVIQYSRSRLIEANSWESNNQELIKLKKTRMPTNQEIYAVAPKIQLCRQCSIQTLRNIVIEQRANPELFTVIVNNPVYEETLQSMLRGTGVRSTTQTGQQLASLRQVDDVHLYRHSDITHGRYEVCIINKKGETSQPGGNRTQQLEVKLLANSTECPLLEELFELGDRVIFRDRLRLGALPSELFAELEKVAKAKGKKVPKKPNASDEEDDDVLEIELEDEEEDEDEDEEEGEDDDEEENNG